MRREGLLPFPGTDSTTVGSSTPRPDRSLFKLAASRSLTPSYAFYHRCAAPRATSAEVKTATEVLVRTVAQDRNDPDLADLIPNWDASKPVGPEGMNDQRLCWSAAIWWAWEDLNFRPHPET